MREGGIDAEVRVRISKAKVAFHQLKNIRGSTDRCNNTKIRIFNAIVKTVLFYGAETSRITVTTSKEK